MKVKKVLMVTIRAVLRADSRREIAISISIAVACLLIAYYKGITAFAYLGGYLISVVLGGFVIWEVNQGLRRKYPLKREECKPTEKSPKPWPIVYLPLFTGILDRLIYTSVWLTPYKEFIGIWLLVKVARGWRVPMEDTEEDKKGSGVVPACSTARYNIFLISNALCVIFGVLGGVLIRWFLSQ